MTASSLPLNGANQMPMKEDVLRRRNINGSPGPETIGNGQASPSSSLSSTNPISSPKKPFSLRRCKRFAGKRTWTIPLALVLACLSLYALNPTESNPISHFIFLSYRVESLNGDPSTPTQYGKGLWDIAFVSFYVLVLSFTREFIMQEILRPLAASHIKSRAKQARFMEQAYTMLYFGVLGPAGLYVMRQTPVWYFNTRGMYELFPHRTHAAEFKFYYLFEAAYWAQQAVVMLLGMEKRRKDFMELVAHHIVTLALIALSYRFHFTYMGIAVYITHDISDFFLAVSKSLHYIAPDIMIPFYATSIGAWIYLRHVLNLRILYSLLTEFRTVGPYELNWETQQYKCWISNVITFGLLAVLQALNLFWLYCLLRSAFKFLATGEKKDDRSETDEAEIGQDEFEVAGGINGHASQNGSASPSGKFQHATDSAGIAVKTHGAR
ncbi:TRAM1-like protein [Penicillium robsamsonii]|uniref:TRAM1-like protein n=1 Tax=Penicillium robsamsonii TaxID=1792511 RepID=UPI00254933A6|nr:TRAM1-like protein [Penicillium robsamsonii]KAJ5811009.1 TRAM1-like protein [Penicillium robsamsonii]